MASALEGQTFPLADELAMATRSTPRLVPGAHLGAHRTINLVRNEPSGERPGATEAAGPTAGHGGSDAAAPSVEDTTGLASRLASIGRPVWLSDMLVPERNSFGVLRLSMALAVLVSHAVFLATGQNTAEPLYGWTGYTLGQHGVQVMRAALQQATGLFYSEKEGGMGVGLNVVEEIVSAHQGSLRIKNHPEGGAVVELELPCGADGDS